MRWVRSRICICVGSAVGVTALVGRTGAEAGVEVDTCPAVPVALGGVVGLAVGLGSAVPIALGVVVGFAVGQES